MKIALIVPGGVDPGGEERVIPWLLWLLARLTRDHEVHVFAMNQPDAPPRFVLRDAHIHVIGRPLTGWRAAAAILGEHQRRRFDVIHGFWAWPQGWLATRAGRVLNVPAVVHLCGGEMVSLPEIDYGEQRSRRGRRRVASALRGARCVAAQSTPMVEAAARFGVTALRLPLGVDLDEWPAQEPRPRSMDRPARLVCVASIRPVKDHATAIRAAAELAAGGLDFTMDIIGEDGTAGRLATMIRDVGLEPRVRLHGYLRQPAVRSVVSGADILVQSARHESGPIVMLEAALAGVPTVGTAVGYTAEWAPEAATAVAPRDAVGLAAAIRDLLEDDSRRIRTAELAQALAIRENADWTASRLIRLYDELAQA